MPASRRNSAPDLESRSGETDEIAIAAARASGTLGKRFDRRVLAEIRDAPASGAQGDAKRDEPEIVLLARGAGEESTRAGAAIPAPREPGSLPRMSWLAKCS